MDSLVLSLENNKRPMPVMLMKCVRGVTSVLASVNVLTLESTKLKNYSLVRFVISSVLKFLSAIPANLSILLSFYPHPTHR